MGDNLIRGRPFKRVIVELIKKPELLGCIIKWWVKEKSGPLIELLRRRKILKLIYASILMDF